MNIYLKSKILQVILSITVLTPVISAEARKIHIDYITDLSGIGAYWGLDQSLGAKLAEADLRAEGLNVDVIITDHRFNTKEAIIQAQRLVALDKVDAVKVDFAPLAQAVSTYLAGQKILFLNESAAVSISKENPYAFTGYLDYKNNCREIAKYWKSQGYKTIGFLKLPAQFAELCYEGAGLVFPGLILKSYDFNEDLTSHILVLKEKNVEAIFNPGLEGDSLNMLKAMETLKFNVPYAGTKEDNLSEDILRRYGNKINRAIVFDFPPVTEVFLRRLKNKFPEHKFRSLTSTAACYLHITQLIKAVIKCPYKDIECQKAEMSKLGGRGCFPSCEMEGSYC